MPSNCSFARRPLLAALGLASAGLRPARATTAPERVSLRLDWLTWGAHAPFHLAAAKGWFARNGLDVRIEDGNGSVTAVQMIGLGQFDVGHVALGPMAMARSKGAPVRAIANFARQNEIGVMVPKGSELTVQSLRGKRLAYTASSLETPFIDSFLAAGGMTRNDVQLVGVDGAAKPGVYVSGRVDGVISSIPSFMPTVQVQKPTTAIRFVDHGLSFPSFGLIASEKTIQERPEMLRRLASTVAGTWTYILNGHEDEAVQAILAARPQAKLPPAMVRDQIDTLRGFFNTEATKGQPVGTMALADWEVGLRTLDQAKLIDQPLPVTGYFTNDVLDAALIAEVARGAA